MQAEELAAEPTEEWPTITEWVVNGEPFLDLCDARDYADRLERRGETVTLEPRQRKQ